MTEDYDGFKFAVLVTHTDPNRFNVLLADTLTEIQRDRFIVDIKFSMHQVPERLDIQYAALVIAENG